MNKQAYLGLGSNIGNKAANIRSAIQTLKQTPGIHLRRISSLYATAPIGKEDQPTFINAAVSIDTLLSPFELLHILQQIENVHKRQRTVHWGPRTLDLDLLLYASQIIDSPSLQIPHPYLTERSFVLVPLNEIEPDLIHPLSKRLLSDYPAASAEPKILRHFGSLCTD